MSNITVVSGSTRSSTSPLRIRIPGPVAMPLPTISAAGVAMPRMHGPPFKVASPRILDGDHSDLSVLFDCRPVSQGWGKLDTPVPADACTIQRSQSTEYPPVVIPLLTQPCTMLPRNLLRTGIIRGKRPVVLMGQKGALTTAVKNHPDCRPWPRRSQWLEDAAPQDAALPLCPAEAP